MTPLLSNPRNRRARAACLGQPGQRARALLPHSIKYSYNLKTIIKKLL